ncbi:MAG: hypothetical protein NVSMB17_01210 [Candidatus Dormibacteria bacterium]
MRTRGVQMGQEVEYDEVSLDQAEDLRAEGATIVDVRRPDERRLKHIPGSLHVPLDELEGRMAEIPEGRVLVVCAKGARSAVGASLIEKATGRTDISSIAGGTDGWEAADKPISRD